MELIIPKIADKKVVYNLTVDNARSLMECGANIYIYTPGFNHEKLYIFDDYKAIIGTSNLDYRSLIHNFENGVILYNSSAIDDMITDFNNMKEVSERLDNKKEKLIKRLIITVTKLLSPLF